MYNCLMFHARHSTVHVRVTKMCGAFSLHLPSFSKHWLFTWTVRMLPMKTPPQNWATGRQNDKRLGCCSRVHRRKSCECSTCHVLNDSNNDDEATQVLDLSLITQIIDLLARGNCTLFVKCANAAWKVQVTIASNLVQILLRSQMKQL